MNKDEKYMRWCIEGAKVFSTCSKRQYMSIIIDEMGRISGTGYNGSPPGMIHCSDGGCPRAYETDTPINYDNCISIHAEENALLYSDPYRRHTMYVNGVPCYSCAKKIAGSGLKRLVYLDDKGRQNDGVLFLQLFMEVVKIDDV